ncbi:MAG: hypothetical protein H7A24_12240 [Leptospiraceae bacterium]|nr:hypothetical protein [Leptospiraceae bacterium]MCP5512644.1 hypothetical protein [Leptospiraceae bacterium]
MNKLSIILTIAIFLLSCQKKKLKGLDDPAWKEKSLSMTLSVCEKILTCSEGFEKKLSPTSEKLFKEELSKEKCLDTFKKSNVYNLRGGDPNLIQEQYEKCSIKMQNSNCEEIQSKSFLNDDACKAIQSIQSL